MRPTVGCISRFSYATPIKVNISFAKAISRPPSRQRKPCDRWLASWLWTLMPTCTMPHPRIMTPTALMQENTAVVSDLAVQLIHAEGRQRGPLGLAYIKDGDCAVARYGNERTFAYRVSVLVLDRLAR